MKWKKERENKNKNQSEIISTQWNDWYTKFLYPKLIIKSEKLEKWKSNHYHHENYNIFT